ncbi:MAG: hypothetical protein WC523_02390 [Patescibacteria group bacterium]|jgi:predicted DNA-binding protein YlxM (UPF0122 family)
MQAKRSKLITELYLEKKFSMVQIAEELNISPSTVRYWLDKNCIKRRLISEAINSWYFTKFKKESFNLKTNLSPSEDNLKTAGIMLYWGEGGKSGNVVKFTNSDPDMIRLFLSFLRNICGVNENRLKALIHMYPDHKENELKSFWIKNTKIPKERFYKSYIHEGKKGTYKNKVQWGTLVINYPDKSLLKKLIEWINYYKTNTPS